MEDEICFIQIYRPDDGNTINRVLVEELKSILSLCEASVKVVVLEGLPEVFCFGADFKDIQDNYNLHDQNPEQLYNIWLQLAMGPYITVAHVRGKVNAGGIGFVAACDIVLSESSAVYSLSELIFGLIPACVLPFLKRRIGFAKANYMTLSTQPISAKNAFDWGLIDAYEENSKDLLRRHLLRFRRLSKTSILRYKNYINLLDDSLLRDKSAALKVNIEVFSDANNIDLIKRYVKTGQFPWEST